MEGSEDTLINVLLTYSAEPTQVFYTLDHSPYQPDHLIFAQGYHPTKKGFAYGKALCRLHF